MLASLGPAIKLAAMQNVPWAKAWGMMFLGAFVVLESMVFLRKKGEEGHVQTLAQEGVLPIRTRGTTRLREHLELMDTLERGVFVSAIMIHVAIVAWAIVDLCIPGSASWTHVLWLVAQAVCIGLTHNIVPWVDIESTLCPYIYQIAGGLFIFIMLRDSSVFTATFTQIYLCILTLIGPLLLEPAIRLLFAVCPALSVHILLLPETTRWPVLAATRAFVFFIVNLIVCFSWYCYRYDFTGTVNPSWNGVFGRDIK